MYSFIFDQENETKVLHLNYRYCFLFFQSEAATERGLWKKMSLKMSQILQEYTCVEFSC